MATLEVLPRPTPAERADTPVEVEVDEALSVFAATLEDWAAARQSWDFTLHEGHEFGRANNVEALILFVEAEQTSSLRFRLDQLDAVDDLGEELLLLFEERDGIAKVATLTANGLDVELFHILTFT
ncbi:MAG TPA: hypothetical protein VE596_19205 [Gaiellaceae bacterium]|jgi:hypothetical protein|nr:hypothetical protein [Gaiellaceae bacterium]